MFGFSFFCSEPQKREKATVDHKRRSHRHHHRTLSLSLAAHDTQTQTHAKRRNQKSHRSISFICKTARKRDKTRSRASSSSSFRVVSNDKAREFDEIAFFLSGCETTTLRRRFFVACRLLFFATTRARERQTDRQRERKTRLHLLPRRRCVSCLLKTRGVKKSIVISKR